MAKWNSAKPSQEVLFSRKTQAQIHAIVSLNNIQVERATYQEFTDILLDENFDLKYCVDSAKLEVNKGVSVIKTLRYILTQKSLITVYKDFLMLQIIHGDITYIYDQTESGSFCKKLWSKKILQYKAALAIIHFTKN